MTNNKSETIRKVLERERGRVIAAVLSRVECYLPRNSPAHLDVRREVMDATELLVTRTVEAVEKDEYGDAGSP